MSKAIGVKHIIRTRTVEMWIEDGIIRSTVMAGAEQTLQDAEDAISGVEELAQGKKMPSLSDSRGLKSVTREARKFYAKSRAAQPLSAVAVIVTPVSRVIVMFFQKLDNPPYPIKYFTNEKDALDWIEKYK